MLLGFYLKAKLRLCSSELVSCIHVIQSVEMSSTYLICCRRKQELPLEKLIRNVKMADKFKLKTPQKDNFHWKHLSRARKCPFLVMHELPSHNSDVNMNLRLWISFRPSMLLSLSSLRGAGYHQPKLSTRNTNSVYFFSYPNIIKMFIDHQNENGGRNARTRQAMRTNEQTKKSIFQINDLSSWLTRIVLRFGRWKN